MPKAIPVARYLIHKAFAYPFVICWIIGTFAIWIPLSIELARSGAFGMLLDNWTTIPLLLICYAATSGLGLFAGAFCMSWIVLPISRRSNGAPHEMGERVVVLCGPHSGESGFIRNFTTGQGGQRLARVQLGHEGHQKFVDFLEAYEVYKISLELPA